MNIPNPRTIRIEDYAYDLPEERIARFPLAARDQSRLLVYDHGQLGETRFCHLADLLPSGSLVVFNNTRVIQARLHFRKPTGGLIEVFLLEPASPADYEQMFQARGRCSWLCLVGNLKKWREGVLSQTATLRDGRPPLTLTAERRGERGTSHLIDFVWDADVPFSDVLEAFGELPIPPYLNRATQESDKTTYQTVYSRVKGSVAAPTAGLHFTPQVLAELDRRGICREELTLHVGAGTFRPVKSATMDGHQMHTEYVSVTRHTLQALLDHDCQAVAVGTTSVRTLESLYYMGLQVMACADRPDDTLHVSQWEPYDGHADQAADVPVAEALAALAAWMDHRHMAVLHGSTQIIIAPGYRFRIVKRLITNFHQPQSTLLLLVSAFIGDDWRRVYRYALDGGFRFLSYGDASLLMP